MARWFITQNLVPAYWNILVAVDCVQEVFGNSEVQNFHMVTCNKECLPRRKLCIFLETDFSPRTLDVNEFSTTSKLSETLHNFTISEPIAASQRLNQGRSQTLEQDEASFERRRHELLGGSGSMPPPRKVWNLEAQKCSCKHFPWHFSSQKSILGKCRSSLFYCSAILVPS